MPTLFAVAPYENADDLDLYKVDTNIVAELLQSYMNQGVKEPSQRRTVVAIVIREEEFVVVTIPQGKMQ